MTVEEIKCMRVMLGVSQIKLSKRCKISQTMLSNYENGKIDVMHSIHVRIEEALRDYQKHATHLRLPDKRMLSWFYGNRRKRVYHGDPHDIDPI